MKKMQLDKDKNPSPPNEIPTIFENEQLLTVVDRELTTESP